MSEGNDVKFVVNDIIEESGDEKVKLSGNFVCFLVCVLICLFLAFVPVEFNAHDDLYNEFVNVCSSRMEISHRSLSIKSLDLKYQYWREVQNNVISESDIEEHANRYADEFSSVTCLEKFEYTDYVCFVLCFVGLWFWFKYCRESLFMFLSRSSVVVFYVLYFISLIFIFMGISASHMSLAVVTYGCLNSKKVSVLNLKKSFV